MSTVLLSHTETPTVLLPRSMHGVVTWLGHFALVSAIKTWHNKHTYWSGLWLINFESKFLGTALQG